MSFNYTSAFKTNPLSVANQSDSCITTTFKRSTKRSLEQDETPSVKRVSSFNETLSRFYPIFKDTSECCSSFEKMRISSSSGMDSNSVNANLGTPHKIFEIPEILAKILSFVEKDSRVPQEVSPIRRKPMSFQHSLIIHGNVKDATRAWESENMNNNAGNNIGNSDLYSCLLVNKLWYKVTLEMLERKLIFTTDEHFESYYQKARKNQGEGPNIYNVEGDNFDTISCQPGYNSSTRTFICNKLKGAKQKHLDFICDNTKMINLNWIEFYICPYLLPPQSMFANGNITKLVIPCSKMVDDNFLKMVSINCPNLEILDIRACELVTDAGIYSIALNCSKLHTLNVGRHSRGELITDTGISAICRYTQIRTLGLAGCHVTDGTIWEIFKYKNDHIERLSLNNCYKLSNHGIPRVLELNDRDFSRDNGNASFNGVGHEIAQGTGVFPHLNVLELRGCVNITDFKSLVTFRKSKQINPKRPCQVSGRTQVPLLVEGCEIVDRRIKEFELMVDLEISSRIFKDLQEWANDTNDEDVPFNDLFAKKQCAGAL
ncbi:unnamed protein product [Kuraishia capsulata CBS 1993]|uniref:F-box/LRR-repeat protein 15-like leucin rich repeat domain-containing protein n=1 Tax=Kuraishia capsulata CBS 1993 TaxID=1382522 RepID=W6MM12_9ASCO|nr:uncharacterized protein KUCA_T00001908001 [Kuraishia capsulata CBS 1993]CDK25937.1 unnamed protein product [Kuraishia capsulata CBS 1993]